MSRTLRGGTCSSAWEIRTALTLRSFADIRYIKIENNQNKNGREPESAPCMNRIRYEIEDAANYGRV